MTRTSSSAGTDLRLHRERRRVTERPSKASLRDLRSEGEHDRDRILYSSAFRRLGGVTQTVGLGELRLFHNRLTHSVKVAQIGRVLAERLSQSDEQALVAAGGIEPDVVEAVCLSHDLGHPPFGHIGEQELQSLLAGYPTDSFEGNAQSFRTVTKLAVSSLNSRGLNLTRATLGGILKYPWFYKDRDHKPKSEKKWGAYFSERGDLTFALDGAAHRPTPEAELMDVADDITYAIHDFEDFFREGLIPLNRIRESSDEAERFCKYLIARDPKLPRRRAEELIRGFEAVYFPQNPYLGSVEDRAALHNLASYLLDHFLASVSLNKQGRIAVEPAVRDEIHALKQLTWFYVIDSPALATLQSGHRRVIRSLFQCLQEWVAKAWPDEPELARLPITLSVLLSKDRDDDEAVDAAQGKDEALQVRGIADYIASLTEAQTLDLHDRLMGVSARSAIETWIRR